MSHRINASCPTENYVSATIKLIKVGRVALKKNVKQSGISSCLHTGSSKIIIKKKRLNKLGHYPNEKNGQLTVCKRKFAWKVILD